VAVVAGTGAEDLFYFSQVSLTMYGHYSGCQNLGCSPSISNRTRVPWLFRFRKCVYRGHAISSAFLSMKLEDGMRVESERKDSAGA
jgi:hypothetical protein